jgi:hypothetical protein
MSDSRKSSSPPDCPKLCIVDSINQYKSTRVFLQITRDKWNSGESLVGWEGIGNSNVKIEQFATAYVLSKYEKRYRKNFRRAAKRRDLTKMNSKNALSSSSPPPSQTTRIISEIQ